MKSIQISIITISLAFLMVVSLHAQQSENNFKEQFDQQLSYISRILQLAEAMPADTYSWRPDEGVRSVGEVYLHIAQANYYILSSVGVSLPEDIDLEGMNSITGKEEVVDVLKQSIEFTQSAVQDLPESKLTELTDFFGQTVTGQAALMSMLNHMSEHVGQSIAYARVNGVAAPWSQ